MNISYEWLREFASVDRSADEVAQRLTMAGLAVDVIEKESAGFPGIVVGYVVERIKHPNADSLSVCKVDVGKEILEIVCGAPNVDAGQKVAVALAGAPVGDITIAKRKIRGIVSNGMICSEKELGLGDSHAGIMVLDSAAPVGEPFREYLGLNDSIFEIDITPNRADALSHIGVARDVAAICNVPFRIPEIHFSESSARAVESATVEILNAEACPRYSARIVRGVHIGESPKWMQQRLQRAGVRPVNNVVDATNYVMMECGHPLHAFDLQKVRGGKIIVRNAVEGETFVTLDGKSRSLRADTLLICDAFGAVAIAGVMGGQNSEIATDTVDLLIESAYFAPSSIRRTSKFLGLSTDASYRFERGTDIENTIYAVNRAAQLIHDIAGGDIAAGIIDAYPQTRKPKRISVRATRFATVLGSSIPMDEMMAICTRLGFEPKEQSSDTFQIMIPSFRPDMDDEIDVIEEIARIAGYERFAPKESHITMRVPLRTAPVAVDVRVPIRNSMAARGFCEVQTRSLIDERQAATFSESYVKVLNPMSVEMGVLRPHPLPSMLETVAWNIRHGMHDIRIFEIAQTSELIALGESDPAKRFSNKDWLAILMCGATVGSWEAKPRSVDFFDLKAEIQLAAKTSGIDSCEFIPYSSDKNPIFNEPAAAIQHGKYEIGTIGSLRQEILKTFDIDIPVYAAILDIAALQRNSASRRYIPPPRFPLIKRDLAIVAPVATSAKEIEAAIRECASSALLKRVDVFDVFSGGGLQPNERSLAFSLEFGADDRTLRDDEVAAVMSGIINKLERKYKFSLRV